ncbi:hypothetical protein OEZ86_010269 [Tetradesmus obliquus]|nr:hypothetical protein OEZ86_010269 [Tetradesmus obliquus]
MEHRAAHGESVAPESLQGVGTGQLAGFESLKPEDQQKVAAAAAAADAADADVADATAASDAQAPLCAAAAASSPPAPHLSTILLPHLPLLDALLQEPRSICSLMCTDKELLQTLKSTCKGRLQLSFHSKSSTHEEQLAAWLGGEHCCGAELLAGQLQQLLLREEALYEGGEPCTEEDGRPGWCWPDFGERQEAASHASASILQALQAATQLTHLALTRDSLEAFAGCSTAMAALAGLTGLRSISISSWDFSVCPAPLFRALQGLTSLTGLIVSRVTGTSKLRYLPQSLLSLDLGVCSSGICLSHLTNLTSLRTDKLFSLEAGDLLPASLQQLAIGEINSVQRLVGLTNLRDLSAYASHVPQLRLQRLARSLTQLTRVQLCYQSGADDAAAAWPLLPLQHLELQEVDALTDTTILPATLQQIASLTQLTYLYIQRLDSVQADTWEVARVLGNLRQLRGLRLWAAGPWPQRRGQQQQQQQQHAEPMAVAGSTAGVADEERRQCDAASSQAGPARRMQPAVPMPGSTRGVGVEGDGHSGAVSSMAGPAGHMQQGAQAHEQRLSRAAVDASAAAAAAADAPVKSGDSAEDSSQSSLMAVIAALPHLSSLSLSLQGLGSAAAAQLAAATDLTSLKLRACGIGSAALAGLAGELRCLRSLFVEYNWEVEDDVLPVLLRELTALTELDVRYTGVSEAGRQYLQQLTRLQQLQL